jgi:hypothetical protein
MERRKTMHSMTTRSGFGVAAKLLIIVTMSILTACASTGASLKVNKVDAAAMMKSDAGKQAFNTIRFAMIGPDAEKLHGYFLYKDGIEVQSEPGIPFEKLGKMTLQEVTADYQKLGKTNMSSAGSMLNVQEYYRRDAFVGFTAVDIYIDVSIWDITKDDGPPVLRVVYKDLRQQEKLETSPKSFW